MYKTILAILLIVTALAGLGYYSLLVSSTPEQQIERINRAKEDISAEDIEYFYPSNVDEPRCRDDYEITKIADAFDLTVEQARALKEEYGYNQLGFEEFCSYLITIEAESEGIGSGLDAVANNVIEYGYGLIRRDEMGRLELRYGN